ncbi:MAG: hypothetical protein ACXV8S_02795 [Methylobacter sp.]
MIINSSAIQLSSRHQSLKSFQQSDSLRSWKTPKQQPTDKVSLSSSAQILKTDTQSVDLGKTLDANQGVKFLIVKHMVKAITGYEFKLLSPTELTADSGATNIDITTTPPSSLVSQPSSVGGAWFTSIMRFIRNPKAPAFPLPAQSKHKTDKASSFRSS